MAGTVFIVCPGRNIRLKDARVLAPNSRFTVYPTGGLPGIPGPRDVEDGGEIRNYHELGYVCTETEMLAANQKKAKKAADDAAVVARQKADVAAGEAVKAEKKAKDTPEKPIAPPAEDTESSADADEEQPADDGGKEPPAETAKQKKARLKKEAADKKAANKEGAAKEGDKPVSNEPPGSFGG